MSLNTISNVGPGSGPWSGQTGLRAVIDAWNGGAFATGFGRYGSLVVWGGGHQDYYGNEIYTFDLESRRWTRLTNPFAGPINWTSANPDYPDARYPDGTPIPPHTYDQVEYHPLTNSFITLRSMADNTPSNAPIPFMFSFDTRTWRPGPRNTRDHHSSGGWSVYDASRDLFWAEGGSGTDAFSSFNPNGLNADGTYGRFTNYPYKIGITGAVAALDPVRDIILVSSLRTDSRIHAIDLTVPNNNDVIIPYGGSAPSTFRSAHGWEWSQTRNSFIYWSGQEVFELRPPATGWSGSWTWVNITSSSNTVTPDYSPNNVYSRFRIAKYQDVEVAITVNSISGSVYVFRLP